MSVGGSYANSMNILMMLLVNPLINWNRIFDMNQFVYPVKSKVFSKHQNGHVFYHCDAVRNSIWISLSPWHLEIIKPAVEVKHAKIQKNVVEKEINQGFAEERLPSFWIFIPRPGFVFLNFVLVNEWNLCHIEEQIHQIYND